MVIGELSEKEKKTWVNTQHDVICLEQGEGICSLDLKSHAVGYMINSNKLVSYLIEIQLVFFPFARCGQILYIIKNLKIVIDIKCQLQFLNFSNFMR